MKYLFASAAITTVLLSFFSCNSDNSNRISEAELEARVQAKVDEMMKEMESKLTEERESEFEWSYSESEDEMTSEMNKYAQVTSEDRVNLDFPYEVGTYMTLHIRNKGNDTDAFIKVTTGQLHTDYNNPTVLIRFDDAQAESYRVTDAASGDSEYLFFTNPKALIKKMKESKLTKIQCMFYDQGSYVFKFNTAGLTW